VIAVTVTATTWPSGGQRLWTSTSDIATMLFGSYVLPFEAVSVLLTAAVVGGVFLAHREPDRPEEDQV
jgi:NADH-quinone oxidoreductase subunit J